MNVARLRQARLLTGMTQIQVVAELSKIGIELTSAAISKYEKGGSLPSLRVMNGLARVYGRDMGFFMVESKATFSWIGFRKLAALPMPEQKTIMARAELLLTNYLDLRSTLEPEEGPPSWMGGAAEETPEGMEAAAVDLRREFSLGAGPVPSLTDLFEKNGGMIVELDTPHEFDGLSGRVNDAIPAFVLKKKTSVDRRRFSIAHEFAHLAAGVTDDKLAHRFASAFLAPREAVFSEVGHSRSNIDTSELLILKERYGLSMQAWIRRCLDLGVINNSYYMQFCRMASTRGWRRNEPGDCPQKETPTRFRQMVLRAQAEGLISSRRATELCPELEAGQIGQSSARSELHRLLSMPHSERARALLPILEAAAAEYLKRDDADLGGCATEVVEYD